MVKPVVTSKNQQVVQDEFVLGSDLLRANSAKPVTHYRIKESDRGGFFVLNGKRLAAGEWHTISANQLHLLKYVASNVYPGGRRVITEQIQIQARNSDKEWSDIKTIALTNVHNANKPIVFGSSREVSATRSLKISNLFTFREEDGNTIKKYQVKDFTTASTSGYLMLDGRRLEAGKWISLTAAAYSRLEFVGGGDFSVDRIGVSMYDGRYWGTGESTINTIGKPSIGTSDDLILDQLQRISVSAAVSQTGSGPSAISYQIMDGNSNTLSARLMDGLDQLAAGAVHTLTPAEFATLQIQGGKYDQRSLDEFYVRLHNGTDWSDWQKLVVRTEPHHIDALATVGWKDFIISSPTIITYSFMQQLPSYFDPAPSDFIAMNDAMRGAVRDIIGKIESMIDVRFVEVPETTGGIMRFGTANLDDTILGEGWFPEDSTPLNAGMGGDVLLNSDYYFLAFGDVDTPGSIGYLTLLDQICHALGLKRPVEGLPTLPQATDSIQYTTRSLFAHAQTDAFSWTPMLYDIAALQELYGENLDTATGNDVYSFRDYNASESNPAFTLYKTPLTMIYDRGGIDTLSGANQARVGVRIDLRPGAFSSFASQTVDTDFDGFDDDWIRARNNVGITFNSVIENATGSNFNDTLNGNDVANVLRGLDGDDTLNGLGGDDAYIGGAGNDTYIVRNVDGNDRLLDSGSGTDTLEIRSALPGPYGLNSFSGDLKFYRKGVDLYIDMRPDGGSSQGLIRIVDANSAANRIESLKLIGFDGSQLGATVDLKSIYDDADAASRAYKITGTAGAFGNLAVRV